MNAPDPGYSEYRPVGRFALWLSKLLPRPYATWRNGRWEADR